MVPCHCIISHPESAKFLVIKHANGWAPPLLQVPDDGTLMYKPATVNHGMMQKYGLRTTVLRHILSSLNYHCIELEMHASSPRTMQAVWVDRENYGQFSRQDSGADPFTLWFDEQESDDPPQDRSPWEQPGWYREAETWMSGKLEGLGIQATGSVQQFKAGVPVSCILRVATLEGQVYFKAAYQKPPGEARMSSLVAERWPEIAPKPLAIDEKRNWMLFPDFRMKKDNRAPLESYPEFARTLGTMQFEAMGEMEEWKAHGCPDMGLDFLLGRNGEADALYAEAEPLLSSGKAALDSQEMSDLQSAIDGARRDCRALEKFGIAECLTHLDYRPDNWYFEEGKCRVMDWADVALTHPFMGMCGTLSFLDTHGTGEPGLSNAEAVDPALRKRMAESYLSAFESIGTPEFLAEALERAHPVYALFRLYWVARELRYVEPQGPHYLEMRNMLKATARTLIATAAD